MIMVPVTIIILFVGLFIGIPIAFVFLASTIAAVLIGGYEFSFLIPYGYSRASSIILLAVPMFVTSGILMERGGIGEALVNFVAIFVSRIKGGLGVIAVWTCVAFGSISGSSYATSSCIGSIMFPRLEEAGYPKGHSAGIMASAALMGLFIPPSLDILVIAWIGGLSILSSFMATVIPGITLAILLSIINCFQVRNSTTVKIPERLLMDRKKRIRLYGQKTKHALPAIFCPIIILGGIYGGVFTPTEAAAVSAVYAIPVGFFIYKGLNMQSIWDAFLEAASTSATIIIMFFTVAMLSRIYILENIPNKLMDFLLTLTSSHALILLIINLFVIAIGMVMDDGAAILMCTPLLMPICMELGMSEVHFVGMLMMNIGLGLITPPCAPLLYFTARVAKVNVNEMLPTVLRTIIFAWIPTLLLTIYVPAWTEWLPRTLGLI